MTRRVLVVEDEREIADLVKLHLEDLGCEVRVAADGPGALEKARSGGYDLIVLDLALPGMDGLEICRTLRSGRIHAPILMLTARSTEIDRVLGLEIGADDYLTKPFSVAELRARVKALFRRSETFGRGAGGTSEVLRVADLVIDPGRRQVTLGGRPVELTAREFDLLLHFARNPGRVFSRAQLLDAVWGYTHSGYEHTVSSHINNLRAKIEDDPAEPSRILTVWGVGYKLADGSGECSTPSTES
jgi:two-component system OmpR family response regulator